MKKLSSDYVPVATPDHPSLAVLSKLSIQEDSSICEIEDEAAAAATEATTRTTYRVVAALCSEIEEESASGSSTGAPAASNKVVVVLDAEKKPSTAALDWAMSEVCKDGDEITVLAYLQHIMSPMGHKMVADLERFIGVNEACLVMTTSEKLDAIENKIKETGRHQACQQRKIKLEVQIAPGSVAKSVIVREVIAINATWVIFEKNTINDRKYFMEYLTSQTVVRMKSDGRSVETICVPSQLLQTSVPMASQLNSYSSADSPPKMLEQQPPTSISSSSSSTVSPPPSSSPPSSSPSSSSLWGRLRSSMGSRRNNSSSSSSPVTSSRKYGRDQTQTSPTAFNASPMDNAMASDATAAVNADQQQEIQPSAAVNDHQASGNELILHQQEQNSFPEITFSPPRDSSNQEGKPKYAFQQEREAHPDALSRYRRPTRHRRVGNYVVV